jgi:hypothetical protein
VASAAPNSFADQRVSMTTGDGWRVTAIKSQERVRSVAPLNQLAAGVVAGMVVGSMIGGPTGALVGAGIGFAFPTGGTALVQWLWK